MIQLKSLLVAAALLLATGCSTIVHEQNQMVNISSNPAGATLRIDNRSFITPAQVALKGKSEHFFTVEKEGYKPATGKVDGDFRIWSSVVGNIFNLTGLLGFAVDFWGTETAYELRKDNMISLEPMPVPAASPVVPVNPADYLQPSDYLQNAVPPAAPDGIR